MDDRPEWVETGISYVEHGRDGEQDRALRYCPTRRCFGSRPICTRTGDVPRASVEVTYRNGREYDVLSALLIVWLMRHFSHHVDEELYR